MAERVVVTGGAGFIGSHIVDRLLADGFDVVVLDNLSTGLKENLSHVANDIELVVNDIRDIDVCRQVCENARWVFHQAALGSVPRSIEDPALTHDINVTGTLNMLQAARDASVESFVFAASSSAYGDTPTLPKVETMRAMPMSPYAASKLACEAYCGAFASVYDLNAVCLRYFNIFGPRQRPDGAYAAVIPIFANRTAQNQVCTIYGDGGQTRDFTFVANAVEANILAAKASKKASGAVINVATARRVDLNELYDNIAALTGCKLRPAYEKMRIGDVRDSLADIRLAKELLGYEPLVQLEEGLANTIHTFLDS